MKKKDRLELATQSVARLRQIRDELLELEEQEKDVHGGVASATARSTPRPKTEIEFLRARAELYNEHANVSGGLLNLNFGKILPALDDAEIVTLAKDVGLAAKLKDKRVQAASKEAEQKEGCGACGICKDCTTSCTQCITNTCLTCTGPCYTSVIGGDA